MGRPWPLVLGGATLVPQPGWVNDRTNPEQARRQVAARAARSRSRRRERPQRRARPQRRRSRQAGMSRRVAHDSAGSAARRAPSTASRGPNFAAAPGYGAKPAIEKRGRSAELGGLALAWKQKAASANRFLIEFELPSSSEIRWSTSYAPGEWRRCVRVGSANSRGYGTSPSVVPVGRTRRGRWRKRRSSSRGAIQRRTSRLVQSTSSTASMRPLRVSPRLPLRATLRAR